MTPSEKREITMESRCLNYVNSHPGTLASDVPQAYRRFLRRLEKRGALECRVEHNEYCWYTFGAKGRVS